jgi:hypothetical protein
MAEAELCYALFSSPLAAAAVAVIIMHKTFSFARMGHIVVYLLGCFLSSFSRVLAVRNYSVHCYFFISLFLGVMQMTLAAMFLLC